MVVARQPQRLGVGLDDGDHGGLLGIGRVGGPLCDPSKQADRAEIVKVIGELYADTDNNAARRIADVVKANMPDGVHTPTACLACTELPLAFKELERATEAVIEGVLYVNTTIVHAKTVFNELLSH